MRRGDQDGPETQEICGFPDLRCLRCRGSHPGRREVPESSFFFFATVFWVLVRSTARGEQVAQLRRPRGRGAARGQDVTARRGRTPGMHRNERARLTLEVDSNRVPNLKC